VISHDNEFLDFISHFKDPSRAVVCVYVHTITFELNDLWPRYAACWFILKLSILCS